MLLRIKVWRTNCFPPAFEFWTTAEVVNDVVKGAKIQITLNVYAQNCGSNQIHNLAPFSTSLPTSAEECQKFKISPPHFEIENVSRQERQKEEGHSSEIRGLCLMKLSNEMLQNLPYFWNMKTQVVSFISCYFIFSPNECPGSTLGEKIK